ncbi:GAF domain-containing protein [Lysobacter humi (ex Lee et al. 2017)]
MPDIAPPADRSSDDIRRERDRLLELVEVLGSLSSRALPGGVLIPEIVANVERLTRGVGAVLELQDGPSMVYHTATGTVAPFVGLRLPVAGSLSGLCVEHATLLYCRDVETDTRVNIDACRKIGARSMMVVPLLQGIRAIGVLKSVSDRPDGFDAIDEHTLHLAAKFISGLLARDMPGATPMEHAGERA